MRISRGYYFVFWITLFSCSQQEESRYESTAIIGQLDLQTINIQEYSQKVGSLSDGKSKCTAFLSGPSEVSTAGHCVENADFASLRFKLENTNKTYPVKLIRHYRNADFALLEVDGIFESYFSFGEVKDGNSSIVGFNYEKNELASHVNCRISKDANYRGLLVHSCDSLPGMSGAPILQNGKIVGIHLGSLPLKDANGALDSSLRLQENLLLPSQFIKNEFWDPFKNLPQLPPPPILGQCVPWCPSDSPSIGPDVENIIRMFDVSTQAALELSTQITAKNAVKATNNLIESIVAAEFLVNGAICLGTVGTGPGVGATPQGAVFCSASACGCAFMAAAVMVEKNWGLNSSPDDKQKAKLIIESPGFRNAAQDTGNFGEYLVAGLGAIPQGFFGVPNDAIYWSNGGDAYCWVPHPKFVSGSVYGYKVNVHEMTKLRRDGACPGMVL